MATPYIKIVTEKIIAGMFGNPIILDVVDKDGVILDISSYTTLSVFSRSPDGGTVLEFAGAGDTGVSGRLSFTPTSTGPLFDRPGSWDSQVEFEKTSVLAISPVFILNVEPRLGT